MHRKKVIEGIKSMNSLLLFPVVFKRPYCSEMRYLQVMRRTLALYWYLGFSALIEKIFLRLI